MNSKDQVSPKATSTSNFELSLILTLVVLLLVSPSDSIIKVLLGACAMIGIALPRVRESLIFWCIVLTFYVAGMIQNWWRLDNHVWLIGYWCLAILIATGGPSSQREHVLRLNAKWMISLCMAFAVIWKLISPDYLSGDFFEHALLVDSRFHGATSLLTGISSDSLSDVVEKSRTAATIGLKGSVLIVPADTFPEENPAYRYIVAVPDDAIQKLMNVAQFLTWWTVLIESLIAMLFALPTRRNTVHLRNACLLSFIATTYLVAPVAGFGWILCILGMASSELSAYRWTYLTAFIAVQVYRMPYEAVLQAGGWI